MATPGSIRERLPEWCLSLEGPRKLVLNGLILISHHGVCPRINLITMPCHQLLECTHIAQLRGFHQNLVWS